MVKLRVLTHSGEDAVVEMENYNVAELNEQLNDNEINTVIIGDIIFSRIDIKLIKPLNKD
jgi:hypothetical protein